MSKTKLRNLLVGWLMAAQRSIVFTPSSVAVRRRCTSNQTRPPPLITVTLQAEDEGGRFKICFGMRRNFGPTIQAPNKKKQKKKQKRN